MLPWVFEGVGKQVLTCVWRKCTFLDLWENVREAHPFYFWKSYAKACVKQHEALCLGEFREVSFVLYTVP